MQRLRFRLDKLEEFITHAHGKPLLMRTLVLHPCPNAVENRELWHAGPTGQLQLLTVHADQVAGMQVGREYLLDITPVEEAGHGG